MESSSESFRMSELTEKNWKSWSAKLEPYLDLQDLWNVFKDELPEEAARTPDWIKKDRKALNLIKMRVSDKLFDITHKCTHARDAFQQLKEHFEGSGSSKMVMLLDRMFNLKLNPPSTIAEIAAEYSSITNEIAEMKLKEEVYNGYHFLHILPKKYEQAAMALRASGVITFEKARDFLINEERKIGSENVSLAAMKKKPFAKPKMTIEEKMAKYPCHQCGEKGHFRKDCPKNTDQKNKDDPKPKQPTKKLGAMVVKLNNLNTPAPRSTIFHDNGANDHLLNDKSCFENMRPYYGRVEFANETEVPMVGVGDAYMQENEDFILVLKDAKYVPGLKASYICEYNMMKHGLKIKPSLEKTEVTTEEGQVIATAERVNGLLEYTKLKMLKVQSNALSVIDDKHQENNVNETEIVKTIRLWHERLGHVNFGDLNRLFKRIGIKGKLIDRLKCEACLIGKAHSKPFGRSKTTTNRVLELIHSDISGKICIPNRNQYSYFMVLVDDFSRHTTVYLLKEKSEVYKYFKEYKLMVENKFDKKIATLRTDNGGEFKNSKMELFCKENGIRQEYTVPHRPQQNGVAERMNRTLDDMARSLLISAKLPVRFWPEAIQTAAYIRNLCPVSTNKFKIPYEIWNERKGDYKSLVKFGCTAYALILPTGGKFDPKSQKLVFVGYSDDAKAYKLYNPSTRKTIVSRDVEFIENEMQLPKQKPLVEIDENDYVTLRLNLAEDDSPSPIVLEEDINNTTEQVTTEQSSQEPEVTQTTEEQINLESTADVEQPNIETNALEEQQNVEQPTVEQEPAVEQPDAEEEQNVETGPRKLVLTSREYLEFVKENPNVNLKRVGGRPEKVKGQFGPPQKRYHYELNAIKVEPTTFNEANMSDDCGNWQHSMQEEYLSHIENGTWTLVKKPEDRKILKMKWVYKIKTDENGNDIKYKSRLCIRGCAQKYGIDYDETFAPVIRYSGIRFMLTIALKNDLVAHHVDIKTAYLNSDIEEDVYVQQPQGFVIKGKEDFVCKLDKAVYGLKQAARQWNLKLNDTMKQLHFKPSESEPCIFQSTKDPNLMVGVYVDDLIVIGKENKINDFKKKLASLLKITDKGRLHFCLNMQIDWNEEDNSVKISPKKFILKMLAKYGMNDCKPQESPVPTGTVFEKANELNAIEEVTEFQSIVGSMLYLANCTRPDILFGVAKLCQYISAPSSTHVEIAKRILAYLKGTVDYGLVFGKSTMQCSVFADADFGNDTTEGKSMSGVMTFIGSNIIDWHCSKQSLVALSTCEAEIAAIVEATRSAIYYRELLNDLGMSHHISKQKIRIWNDNQSARSTLKDEGRFKRTKHYKRKFFFVQDYIKRNVIDVEYWRTELMPADTLTKPLTVERHHQLMNMYNLRVKD